MIILLVLTLTASLVAMETKDLDSERTVSQSLCLQNATSWKLLVKFSLENETISTTLAPEGKIILPGPLSMSSLSVVPSGEFWSKTQLTTPVDLRALPDFIAYGEGTHLHITISTKKVLGYSNHTAAFVYEFKSMKNSEMADLLINPKMILANAFPDAQAAVDKGEVPFPRHYLSLPHEETAIDYEKSTEYAYQRLTKRWNFAQESNKEFVAIVLDILTRAYTHLKAKTDLLKSSITQRFIARGLRLTLKGRLSSPQDSAVQEAYVATLRELEPFLDSYECALMRDRLKEEYGLIMLKNNLKVPILAAPKDKGI